MILFCILSGVSTCTTRPPCPVTINKRLDHINSGIAILFSVLKGIFVKIIATKVE